jgi:hypothetical protein
MHMPSLINALKSLFGSSAHLSKLEKTIFDAVGQKLQEKEAQLWNGQLAAINKIHRSPDGKEINLWAMRGGQPDFPKELCFGHSEEFKIAVVDVTANAGTLMLRARVWCVEGHVFSIEYKNSFKEFEKSAQGDWQVHCHIENYPI